METRIAGQREFDRGGGEPAAGILVGVAHRAGQQRAGGLLGVGVGVVGTRQSPFQLLGPGAQRGVELAAHQRCFGLDIQPGQDERGQLRKPPMLLSETFSVGGGARRAPGIRTRSVPSSPNSIGSNRAVASGLA